MIKESIAWRKAVYVDALQLARWRRANPISYLGWIGHKNIGDEAIYAGNRKYFTEVSFIPFPLQRAPHVLAASAKILATPPNPRLLLGGGTVVGRPEWAERVLNHQRLTKGEQSLTVWGAGVEDPRFSAGRGYADDASFATWRGLLNSAVNVGVRGPLSMATLADFDVDSRVVGDPALRLRPTVATPPVAGRVLMNLAVPEATYSGSDRGWHFRQAVDLARRLLNGGHDVKLFGMHPDDGAAIGALINEVHGLSMLECRPNPQSLLDAMASADVIVSERLHGNVLAAAAGRPFVSLDYRPKCADFAASVSRSDFNIQLQSGVAGEIAGLVDQVRVLPTERVEQYLAAVEHFRRVPRPSWGRPAGVGR